MRPRKSRSTAGSYFLVATRFSTRLSTALTRVGGAHGDEFPLHRLEPLQGQVRLAAANVGQRFGVERADEEGLGLVGLGGEAHGLIALSEEGDVGGQHAEALRAADAGLEPARIEDGRDGRAVELRRDALLLGRQGQAEDQDRDPECDRGTADVPVEHSVLLLHCPTTPRTRARRRRLHGYHVSPPAYHWMT